MRLTVDGQSVFVYTGNSEHIHNQSAVVFPADTSLVTALMSSHQTCRATDAPAVLALTKLKPWQTGSSLCLTLAVLNRHPSLATVWDRWSRWPRPADTLIDADPSACSVHRFRCQLLMSS